VLVTGASSGIGLELARLFAADGYRVVLTGRNRRALEDLARELTDRHQATSVVLPRDLADPKAPDDIFRELDQAAVAVDVLVNNAGYGVLGRFAEADLTAQLGMLQVNMAALTHLTWLALNRMVPRKAGKILNVASTAAFQPGPLLAVYFATKAYVLSFSEALSEELRSSGITVTALCPGPTQTDFQRRAGMRETIVMSRGVMTAQAVALAGYRGLMRGQRLVVPGLQNRALARAARILPKPLVLRVVRAIQEPRRPAA